MWGHDRRVLKSLVRKNLLGHARRNAKTAILFTTCIAFMCALCFLFFVLKLFCSSVLMPINSDFGTVFLPEASSHCKARISLITSRLA
jgi:hypothetical protein